MYSLIFKHYRTIALTLNALALLGALGLSFGWYFDIDAAIDPIGPFSHVHFDGVLAVLLVSLGAVLPDGRWRRLAQGLIGLVWLMTLLTLVGYTMRFGQPLNAFLHDMGLLAEAGRADLPLPFPTALALMFVCSALLILRLQKLVALQVVVMLASSLTAAAIMVQDLFSQLGFLREPDFAETHDVSLQLTLLVLLLTAPLCLRAWAKLQARPSHRLDHYYAWSTVVLLAAFLTAWEYQERVDWAQRAFETEVALRTAKSEIAEQLRRFGTAQQHLANRWSIFGNQSEATWSQDAGAVLEDSPGLYAIAYVDPGRVVRWRVSADGENAKYIGKPLDDDPVRRATFDLVDRVNTQQMSETIVLADGRAVRLYITPLFHGVQRSGYLLGALLMSDVGSLVPVDEARDFNIQIFDHAADLKSLPMSDADPGARVRRAIHLETLGQYWTVAVWPKEGYLEQRRSRLLWPTLVFGGLMTLLVAAAFSQTRQSQISLRREDQAKTRLTTTLDRIDEGFVTLDRSWTITYANARAARIIGLSKEEIIGASAFDLSAAMDGIPEHPALSHALEGKGSGHFTGNQDKGRTLDAVAYPTDDGMALMFRDVTKERERDEFLRLLESAVARQNDVLVITDGKVGGGDETQRIFYVNDAFTRVSGYSRDEAIGRSPRFLQGVGTSRAMLDRIREAVIQRRPVQVEIINYAKDGTEYWIELDIAPIFDAAGQCTHFVGVERDVTERKRLQAHSAYVLERFQHIVDVTNDIIWDADLATGLVEYNENLKEILGHDPALRPLTTSDWEDWLHPDDREKAVRIIAEETEQATAPVDMEYRIRKADGSYAIVTDRAKVIRDETGKALRIVGTMSDVTEKRGMADRLRQAQQLEAVGQLTGGVAHDFNNLLTVILGNSELLADRLTDQPKLQKLAEMTVTMALRGSELTGRLLAFARRQPLDPKRIDVAALILAMEDWLRRTLPATIALSIANPPDLWQIEADPSQLENAILNLAVNSRDAMPQGGTLHITSANCEVGEDFVKRVPQAHPGRYLRISVRDSGTGMSPETLARAFDPFFTTKAMGKGSGLGLSMVYGFLQQSSGFAQIESELGKGTAVHLYFPMASAQSSLRKHQGESDRIVGGTEHVLAVEDEENVLENVVAKLTSLGYRVSAALSGTLALQIIADDPSIDLLFTDIVMPGDLNGPELVKRAKGIRPDLKVLYTSGYTDDTITRDGRVEAGVSLLTKPYRLGDLAEKLREVLDV